MIGLKRGPVRRLEHGYELILLFVFVSFHRLFFHLSRRSMHDVPPASALRQQQPATGRRPYDSSRGAFYDQSHKWKARQQAPVRTAMAHPPAAGMLRQRRFSRPDYPEAQPIGLAHRLPARPAVALECHPANGLEGASRGACVAPLREAIFRIHASSRHGATTQRDSIAPDCGDLARLRSWR
jgi:hypothetical protein